MRYKAVAVLEQFQIEPGGKIRLPQAFSPITWRTNAGMP